MHNYRPSILDQKQRRLSFVNLDSRLVSRIQVYIPFLFCILRASFIDVSADAIHLPIIFKAFDPPIVVSATRLSADLNPISIQDNSLEISARNSLLSLLPSLSHLDLSNVGT